MKKGLLTAAVCAAFFSANPGYGEAGLRLAPEAVSVPVDVQAIRSANIAKLSWQSAPNEAYVIETTETLRPSAWWEVFSIERSTGTTTRRSIILHKPSAFFRVRRLQNFSVGETVEWGIDLPNPPSNEETCWVTWTFDDGTRYRTYWSPTDADILDLSYTTPGLRTAEVFVDCDSGFATTKWGVNIIPSNLIANANLEMGANSPTGWLQGRYGSNSTTFKYPVLGANNSRAAQVIVSNYMSGDAKWFFADIPVTPGARYLWSDMYQSTAPTIATVRYTLSGGSFRYVDIGTFSTSGPRWATAGAELTAPSDARSATVFHLLKSNGALTIDNASFAKFTDPPPLTEAMVSLDFDDGWRQAYLLASNVLKSAQFRGTFHIVISRVGRDTTMVNRDDLYAMLRDGHEISSHTVNHLDLTDLPLDWAEWEINIARFNLISAGIEDVSMFAYPFGAYTEGLKRIVKEAGYSGARSVNSGFNTPSNVDPYALNAHSLRATNTLAEIKGWINSAMAQKAWLILVFHRVDESNTSHTVRPEVFSAIVDYLKQNHVKVVTTSEGLRLLGRF